MDFARCDTCGEYGWTDEHKCSPFFYFTHENWGDEPQKIMAKDFDQAAMRFAALYNEDGDYALMNDSIEVIISDGGTEKKYMVSAEPDIYYRADEIKEPHER